MTVLDSTPQFNNEGTRTHDNLIAGDAPIITDEGTLVSAAGNDLSRGAVLGKITLDSSPTVAADGGNTGDGTVSGVSLGEDAQDGVYTLECTAAATDGGTFKLIAPNGDLVADDIEVGTAFTSNHLNLTVNDGATDFADGDSFTIDTSGGSDKLTLCDDTATDGSQNPVAILAVDTDASAADKNAIIYIGGEFTEDALSFGGSHDADSVRDRLRELGIYLKSSVTA